jgi:hypothetical protein
MTESISDFALYLRTQGKSPLTIKKYCEAVRRLHRFVVSRGASRLGKCDQADDLGLARLGRGRGRATYPAG